MQFLFHDDNELVVGSAQFGLQKGAVWLGWTWAGSRLEFVGKSVARGALMQPAACPDGWVDPLQWRFGAQRFWALRIFFVLFIFP